MNEFKKGTITVIAATIVTSGMILLTGNSIAYNKEKKEKQNEVSTVNTTGQSIPQPVESIIAADSGIQIAQNKLADIPLPPPGPFTQIGQDSNNVINKPQALIAPTAPKAPVATSSKGLIPPAKPEKKPFAPEMKSLQAKKPVSPSSSVDVNGIDKTVSAPELKRTFPMAPSGPENPVLKTPEFPETKITAPTKTIQVPVQKSVQAMPPKAPKSLAQPQAILNNNKPIWMQQNQGVPSSENMQPMIGGSSNMGAVPQGQNPQRANVMQQYRYVPVPIYPGYNNQQMPMQNGGYYFAPIPKYWMPQMMPGQAPMQQTLPQQSQPTPNSQGSN
mgnify:CR=1 FL=1